MGFWTQTAQSLPVPTLWSIWDLASWSQSLQPSLWLPQRIWHYWWESNEFCKAIRKTKVLREVDAFPYPWREMLPINPWGQRKDWQERAVRAKQAEHCGIECCLSCTKLWHIFFKDTPLEVRKVKCYIKHTLQPQGIQLHYFMPVNITL